MQDPLVSVIMPVYNGEKFLKESIDSILNQTYTNFELLIINDASTDSTAEIIKSYEQKDSRVKMLNNKFEKGIAGGLNTGLEAAKGELIARADGDDINKNSRFETQVKYLQSHQDISTVGGGYAPFRENSRREVFHPSNSIELAWKFISNTYFCHPTVMFWRKIIDDLGGYPIVASEDFGFFSKVLKKYKGTNIHEILIDYREHKSNYSSVKGDAISQSLKQTSLENFKYYTGSNYFYDQFIRFQNSNVYSIGDYFKLLKINLRVINKIKDDYKSSVLSFEYLDLLFKIKIKFVKGFFNKIFR